MMIKNAKRFLSFVCALTMIATFNVCAFASEYSDDVDKPMAGVRSLNRILIVVKRSQLVHLLQDRVQLLLQFLKNILIA